MNLKITFKSGEEGVNRREFELEAYHMDPAPDTVAPLLIHLTDLLTNLHPGDLMEIFPEHVPELSDYGHDPRRGGAAVSEFEQAAEAFRRKWGFDPAPAVESAFRRGEFEVEGGTEDERAFIREALTAASGTGCDYCTGDRCDCTCEQDCGARPGGSSHYCPRAEGYVDWLRGTGLYSETELAKLAEGGAR